MSAALLGQGRRGLKIIRAHMKSEVGQEEKLSNEIHVEVDDFEPPRLLS